MNPKTDAVCITLIDENSELVLENGCASLLNRAFCSVFAMERSEHLPSANQHHFLMMNPTVFNSVGILNIIDSLKHSSFVADNQISSKILQNIKDISSAILSLNFSQSLATSVVADDWHTRKIIRILKKKGDK